MINNRVLPEKPYLSGELLYLVTLNFDNFYSLDIDSNYKNADKFLKCYTY